MPGVCWKIWVKRSLIALISMGVVIALSAQPTFSRDLWKASVPFFHEGKFFVVSQASAQAQEPFKLPTPRPHPLPSSLANWKDSGRSGDYFDQIKPVNVGYLVWSEFPITVFIEPLTPDEAKYPFTTQRAEIWIKAVLAAVKEWNQYLPLQVVNLADGADITIRRSPPPIRFESPDSSTDQSDARNRLPIARARSAETRFELYIKQPTHHSSDTSGTAPSENSGSRGLSKILAHRFTIQLRPDQAASYLQAAARHELGHALGIWGHSPLQSDAMYFSQVSNSPLISPRDVNTLKRVYEQPTRLGWAIDQ